MTGNSRFEGDKFRVLGATTANGGVHLDGRHLSAPSAMLGGSEPVMVTGSSSAGGGVAAVIASVIAVAADKFTLKGKFTHSGTHLSIGGARVRTRSVSVADGGTSVLLGGLSVLGQAVVGDSLNGGRDAATNALTALPRTAHATTVEGDLSVRGLEIQCIHRLVARLDDLDRRPRHRSLLDWLICGVE